jgi:hypothetical protein
MGEARAATRRNAGAPHPLSRVRPETLSTRLDWLVVCCAAGNRSCAWRIRRDYCAGSRRVFRRLRALCGHSRQSDSSGMPGLRRHHAPGTWNAGELLHRRCRTDRRQSGRLLGRSPQHPFLAAVRRSYRQAFRGRLKWLNHLVRSHEPIELRFADRTQPNCRLAQRRAVFGSVFRNPRRLVISNRRDQGRHQHE